MYLLWKNPNRVYNDDEWSRQKQVVNLGPMGLVNSGWEGHTREGKSEMHSSPDSAIPRTVISDQSSRSDLRFYAKYYLEL